MPSPVQPELVSQYLSFRLSGDHYAIAISRVREIVEYEAPTRVPGTPSFVRGVTNLRGSVLPVLDLALKVGVAASAPTRKTCIVLVEIDVDGERLAMGLVVDEVIDVLDLSASDIAPPPPFGAPVKLEYLEGLGKVGTTFVLVLAIDRVLSPEELAIAASLGSEAPEAAGASLAPQRAGLEKRP